MERIPKKYSSLSPYRAMYRELEADDNLKLKYPVYSKRKYCDGFNDLKKFINGKRNKFNAKTVFNTQTLGSYKRLHKKWQTRFSNALGEPGAQYFKLLKTELRDDKKWSEVIITKILEHPNKYPALRKGAYAYALFRCLYGFTENQQKRGISSEHKEWIDLLHRKWRIMPKAKCYLKHLKKNGPCWANYAKKIASQERQVLNSLKFYTVYRLYANDWLKGNV